MTVCAVRRGYGALGRSACFAGSAAPGNAEPRRTRQRGAAVTLRIRAPIGWVTGI
jgi:hypothetical protein